MDHHPKISTTSSEGFSSSEDVATSHWALVSSQSLVTDRVEKSVYAGAGTKCDPFLVEWIPDDPRDPWLFSELRKWSIVLLVAVAGHSIMLSSTVYTSSIPQVMLEFPCSDIVATLGMSLFTFGFAVGPLIWSPLSEVYGRQIIFMGTFAAATIFSAGAAAAPNIESLFVLRFLAGTCGSSALTTLAGVLPDLFPPIQRNIAMCVLGTIIMLGQSLGPVVGGFLAESAGWRWVQGLSAAFIGLMWMIGILILPETYAPVILEKRAATLSKKTGKVFVPKAEAAEELPPLLQVYKIALSRPWALLFREPIVLLMSAYLALVYGILYLSTDAFPIVYEHARGWTQGIGGLSFLGVVVGTLLGALLLVLDDRRYRRLATNAPDNYTPPEARIPPLMVAAVVLPISLFVFAWTNYAHIPWIVSLLFTSGIGFANVIFYVSISNYLIDSYTIYSASVLAACDFLMSVFGSTFPLFTRAMYAKLGIHWASCIPAFLALVCVPIPFFFHRYGAKIRSRCRYAKKAAAFEEEVRATQG